MTIYLYYLRVNNYFYNSEIDFHHKLKVDWKKVGIYPESENQNPIVQKTLTDITKYPDYVKRLKAMFESEGEILKRYNKKDALKDLFISESEYDNIVELLNNSERLEDMGKNSLIASGYAEQRADEASINLIELLEKYKNTNVA